MKKLLFSLMLIFSIMLTGCAQGLVDNVTYNNLIGGITARTAEEGRLHYSLEALTNIVNFDNEIESRIYDEIKIENKANFKMFAFYLYVKTDETCNLKFELFLNNNLLKELKCNLIKESGVALEFIFENDIEVLTNDELVIKVSKYEGDEQIELDVNYQFDNLVIFFKE